MREVLWEDYLIDNPKLARKIEAKNSIIYDDEFDKIWEDSKLEEVDINEDISSLDVTLPEESDIPYSPYGRNILKRLQKKNEPKETLTEKQQRIKRVRGADWEDEEDSKEWEEVDLDSEEILDTDLGNDFSAI